MAGDVAAAPPRPAFRRRREVGAASARSLLLTVLGEFVLPSGLPVWTSSLLAALALLGVEEKAARQALARTAAEGWVAPRRRGRRTAWELTEAGRQLLTEGAARIYGFGAPAAGWDGRWLLLLVSAPDAGRQLRHQLRTRLEWGGLGTLAPGVWVGAHPERQAEVVATLTDLGLAGAATCFVARMGGLGDPGRVARQAWNLAEIELRYEEFLEAVRPIRPSGPAATLVAQVRLVQEWRRFPFLDPGLPAELLPDPWSGTRAAALFRARHARWKPLADRHWRQLSLAG